jgi:hypothetical protein
MSAAADVVVVDAVVVVVEPADEVDVVGTGWLEVVVRIGLVEVGASVAD